MITKLCYKRPSIHYVVSAGGNGVKNFELRDDIVYGRTLRYSSLANFLSEFYSYYDSNSLGS